MTQIRIVVHGRVQGVGFRYHTRQTAQQLGVTGFVRNLVDGTVEIVADGADDQLKALVAWTHQGPPAARVSAADVSKPTHRQRFDSFTVEP
ncbi:MAG: acylphosphatase [Nodosilinea sp.]